MKQVVSIQNRVGGLPAWSCRPSDWGDDDDLYTCLICYAFLKERKNLLKRDIDVGADQKI